ADLLPEWDRTNAVIDPTTWRQVALRTTNANSDHFDIHLLRPVAWLNDVGARVGQSIDLALPEQGFDGEAEVLAIEPCPAIKSGNGRVVTGTFAHTRGGILDLYFDGAAEPLGVTENHRVYCVDRDDFVRVGELQVGERLRQLVGPVACI